MQDGPDIPVPRRFRYEITERVDAQGEIVLPLAEGEIPALVEAIRAAKLEAVSVVVQFENRPDSLTRG